MIALGITAALRNGVGLVWRVVTWAGMHQDPHGHEPSQALRMTHGLPDATERAFRRAEGVEGDPKAICLSGGEG